VAGRIARDLPSDAWRESPRHARGGIPGGQRADRTLATEKQSAPGPTPLRGVRGRSHGRRSRSTVWTINGTVSPPGRSGNGPCGIPRD
jgi:hypothetical protein